MSSARSSSFAVSAVIVLIHLTFALAWAAPHPQPPQNDTTDQRKTDWLQVVANWLEYVHDPTKDNASLVLGSIPVCPPACSTESKERALAMRAVWRFAPILQKQVLQGKAYAVELAFRLSNFSDADLSEQLYDMLGDIILKQPRLFMAKLQQCRCPNTSVDFYLRGSSSPLRSSEQSKEWRRRAEALRKVKDASLIPLRDECVKVLTSPEEE
jgi:hypothetical protein